MLSINPSLLKLPDLNKTFGDPNKLYAKNKDIVAFVAFLGLSYLTHLALHSQAAENLHKLSPTWYTRVQKFKQNVWEVEDCRSFYKAAVINYAFYLYYKRYLGSERGKEILAPTVIFGVQKFFNIKRFNCEEALIECREKDTNGEKSPVFDQVKKRVIELKGFPRSIICLVGSSGAGKTFLLDDIFSRMKNQNLALCYKLNIEALKNRAMAVEDPQKRWNMLCNHLKVLSKANGDKKILLFYDEFYSILGDDLLAGRNFLNAFKRFLGESDNLPFFIVAATTEKEFEILCGQDSAIGRRIAKIPIPSKTSEEVKEITRFSDDQLRRIEESLKKSGRDPNQLLSEASDIKRIMESDSVTFDEALDIIKSD